MQPLLRSRLAGIATEMQDFAADVSGWMRERAARLSGVERRQLAERFGAWALADGNLTDAALRAWIEDLDDIGREALAEQVGGFCADFDIDLAWLVDGELAEWPALEAGMRALVTDYCRACKAAVECDADSVRFRRRLLWERKREDASTSSDPD
jgi:hypothetical protein